MQITPSLFRKTVDLFIPLRCVKCGEISGNQEGLCPRCWGLIPFITAPLCACCGLPFEFEIEENALCGACLYERPLYATARSVFGYTAESKDLILKFKHLDGLNAVPLFAQWMAGVCTVAGNPLCIPVPLHWTRLFMRTYNQAALLARELARRQGWMYSPSTLVRQRRTSSQGFLSPKERKQNVAGSFRVPDKKKPLLFGKNVVLVDDVFTTGATLNACVKTLMKAGVSEVHALTLGRVVRARKVG